jgi:hypothetical protein
MRRSVGRGPRFGAGGSSGPGVVITRIVDPPFDEILAECSRAMDTASQLDDYSADARRAPNRESLLSNSSAHSENGDEQFLIGVQRSASSYCPQSA